MDGPAQNLLQRPGIRSLVQVGDVRSKKEWTEGHLEGARQIYLG
jgi:hypothetical protein